MSILPKIQAVLRSVIPESREEDDPENKGRVITLCILASCILWFAFSMQENYIQVLDFPTEVQNLPENRALAAVPPSSVRIQLEGEGIQILRLFYNPPVVPIDVTGEEVDLALAAPEIIKNVSVQTVTPRTVRLAVEDRVRRRIPVEPRIRLDFSPGYRLIGSVRAEPDSIWISGARSIVQDIRAWPTATRNLGQMRDSLDAMVALSDSLTPLLDLEVSEVRVIGDIQAFTEARRSVEVRATGLPPGVRVTFSPAVVDVIYQVPLSQYDRVLQAQEFYAFVPYEDILRDVQGRVFPMLHLPDGLDVRSPRFEPESLRYYDVRRDD
jgi:YbbR domain-containing protein